MGPSGFLLEPGLDQLEEVFSHESIQREDLEWLFRALNVLARSGRAWVLGTVCT